MMKIINSRFYSALIILTDYFLLGLLWLVTSIPLVTLLHSTAAVAHVIKKWHMGESGRVLYFFFSSFFANFFKKTFFIIMIVMITLAIYFSFSIISQQSNVNPFNVVPLVLSSVVTLGVFIRAILVFSDNTSLTFISIWKKAILVFIVELPQSILFVLLVCGSFTLITFIPLSIIILPVLVIKIICLGSN